jgi:hypothetical protein
MLFTEAANEATQAARGCSYSDRVQFMNHYYRDL